MRKNFIIWFPKKTSNFLKKKFKSKVDFLISDKNKKTIRENRCYSWHN